MAWLNRKILYAVFQVAILAMVANSVSGIHCYKCENAASNEECSMDEHLVDCDAYASGGTKYDICQTIVIYAGKPQESITKKCSVSPCELDENQNNALGLECTGDTCTQCCDTDGCNKAGAPRQVTVSMALQILPLLVLAALLHAKND